MRNVTKCPGVSWGITGLKTGLGTEKPRERGRNTVNMASSSSNKDLIHDNGLECAKRHPSRLFYVRLYVEREELRKDVAYWKEQYRKDVKYWKGKYENLIHVYSALQFKTDPTAEHSECLMTV